MAVRIEDAGFEIRDLIAWVYGSGFPKSHDISKAIDKEAGAEREVVGVKDNSFGRKPGGGAGWGEGITGEATSDHQFNITAPATEAAKQWQGWGTALKPAFEPITMARKPFASNVAANVLEHGTGGLNVDGCRVGFVSSSDMEAAAAAAAQRLCQDQNKNRTAYGNFDNGPASLQPYLEKMELGRWPANFIHDGSNEVLQLFPVTKSGSILPHHQQTSDSTKHSYEGGYAVKSMVSHGDQGSAARFFYTAKASKADRDAGCGIGSNWLDSLELILDNGDFVTTKELSVWEIAGLEASMVLTGGASRLRATFEDTASKQSGSDSGMSSSGSKQTDVFLMGIKFTTSTGTSKTIDSKTLSWLTHLPTNEYTADASKTIADIGLSHAESAALQNLLKAITTSEETVFLLGASNAAKTTQQSTSAKEWLLNKSRRNIHSTVKPTDLMRYLCRLVTPPSGIVLDPFTGSGSTGKAAILEGFRFIGIEREAEYIEIARARIQREAEKPHQPTLFD
jgi:hypothetical protein